jgi:predicted Zn finger-like uncharacterized protein
MDGTTLCPHCDTRFKIKLLQLEAHQGWVRCGHCLQPFDARIDFLPDSPHPQLELAILDVVARQTTTPETQFPDTLQPFLDTDAASQKVQTTQSVSKPYTQQKALEKLSENTQPETLEIPPTLAEQVLVVTGDKGSPKPRRYSWVAPILLLLSTLLLFGQLAYFFRDDIAARLPVSKPFLMVYCDVLHCVVGLPQKSELMSIESSALETDSVNSNQVILTALLRNRASYPLAFPHLELTLNDKQDKAIARRTFKPADYLPSGENEKTGVLANHEVNLRIRLDISDLDPNGYRLLAFYPPS